jgi:multisubunit Na+/H+ antiporter MnhE subunit
MLALCIVLMAAEWCLLVGGFKRDEMIVGAIAVAAAALFLWRAFQIASERLDLRARDVLNVFRLPWMMLSDAWIVTLVLLKDLLHIEPAGSFYRVKGFRTAIHDPLLVARRVLATVYTTCTPNSIVIGIDPTQSRMLIHQLRRSPSSQLERDLGAQS